MRVAGRGVRVPVRHALAGVDPLDRGQRRAQRHRRDEAEVALLRHGRESVDGDAGADEIEVRVGQGERGGRVGEVPQLRIGCPRLGDARARRGRPSSACRSSGGRARRRRRSGSRRRPGRPRRPWPWRRRGRASRRGRQPLRESPVSIFRCTRAGVPCSRAASATMASCQVLLTDRSMSARDRALHGRLVVRASRARPARARRCRPRAARALRRWSRCPARSRRRRAPRVPRRAGRGRSRRP